LRFTGTLRSRSSRVGSSNWTAFTPSELYFCAPNIDVVAQCSYHTDIALQVRLRALFFNGRNAKRSSRRTIRTAGTLSSRPGRPAQAIWRHEDEGGVHRCEYAPSFPAGGSSERTKKRGGRQGRHDRHLLDNFQNARWPRRASSSSGYWGEFNDKGGYAAQRRTPKRWATELGVSFAAQYCVTSRSVVDHAHVWPI